jgi:hypothetical protein
MDYCPYQEGKKCGSHLNIEFMLVTEATSQESIGWSMLVTETVVFDEACEDCFVN